MGAALEGASDFFANWAPTALSKKPGEEGLEDAGCLVGAALVGASDFLANCAPTALSKKPPPEEAGLEEPATQLWSVRRLLTHTMMNLLPAFCDAV